MDGTDVLNGAEAIARFLGFEPSSPGAASATIASLRRQGLPVATLGRRHSRLIASRRAVLAWLEERADAERELIS